MRTDRRSENNGNYHDFPLYVHAANLRGRGSVNNTLIGFAICNYASLLFNYLGMAANEATPKATQTTALTSLLRREART